MALTLPALLEDAVGRHKERVFLLHRDGPITYGETLALVRRAKTYLKGCGVMEGVHVALMMRNHPAFIVTWFALSSLGAVVVPVNTDMKGETLQHIIAQSDSQLLITEAHYRPQIDAALEGCANPPSIIEANDPREYLAMFAEHAPDLAAAHLAGSLPMMIAYTSGTTNMPKGAVLSHRSYLRAGQDMAAAMALTEADRYYLFLPLFHANPQMYGVMAALHAGASIAIGERFSASGFWPSAVATEATIFTYVGTVLSIIAGNEPPRSIGRLRACVGGGAPLSVWKTLKSWGIDVRELYGMTELGGFTTANTAHAAKMGSVGRPRSCQEVEIRGEDGRPLEDGNAGEIVVHARESHVIFEGYYRRPDLTAEVLRDGWFHTGDRGYRDDDGFFYFVDRSKDMIRKKGENISPTHLEELINACPFVQEVSIVGVPSSIGEEDIKLVAVPRVSVSPPELYEWCAAHLPRFMIPRYYEIRPQLPKTATSKNARRLLAAATPGTWDAEERHG